jgi:phage shock protein C
MTSFCSGCGVSLSGGARFCSACGKPVLEPGPVYAYGTFPNGPLMRSRSARKVAGVCQGLATHYGWDVTLTRVIAVILTIAVFPVGLVAYILFWVLLPEEPETTPAVNSLSTTA